ncbi:DUF6325 family protein [Cryptosporangium aurantiacum]|uniref:DUF1269 domain-containing protein n=1 Tax=Cryptosporangium aurantiacum TaxID=134849 RepID=A0A1M7RGH2_9ACTN|nr:DUF6325 family protein [Cryptosporangium aurantiacum]SHN45138.1 hypothetical protein SAMN05443668_111157 [Cryptosporangium aurantiacum]
MVLGPLELMVLTFPADRLDEGVRAALDPLAGGSGMRIADAVAVCEDPVSGTRSVELRDLPGLAGDLTGLATGLIAEADLRQVSTLVDARTVALVVLLEHGWIHELSDSVAAAHGRIHGLTHISGLPGRVRQLAAAH